MPGLALDLDLHGLTAAEALVVVEDACAKAWRERVALRVVHGYQHGSVLLRRVRAFLARYPECLRMEEEVGNPGVTRVLVLGPLPKRAAAAGLHEALLAYCASARTLEKITARFVARHSQPELRAALDELVAQGRLRRETVKSRTMWVATHVAVRPQAGPV